ncbi:MAG: hypothetical protein LUE17_15520 [Planctomycetaceae bacterium]|nr:hypothetical protein [Planctomycetaceae bacterium]
MVSDDGFALPALSHVCGLLGLDICELAEPVLSALDTGVSEREAIRMSIIDILRRRGRYQGELRRRIEDGTIFQIDAEGRRVTLRDTVGVDTNSEDAVPASAGDVAVEVAS